MLCVARVIETAIQMILVVSRLKEMVKFSMWIRNNKFFDFKNFHCIEYIEDICPYATFQLNKQTYSESSYSGNVYSGPYHSVRGSFVYHDVKPDGYQREEPEYTKVRRKGNRLRDPHSESQGNNKVHCTNIIFCICCCFNHWSNSHKIKLLKKRTEQFINLLQNNNKF